MPWRIEKRNNKFCVIKETDNSVEKCHDTRAKALAHQKALYVAEANSKAMNENDEQVKEQKEQTVDKGYVPYGISTFDDLDNYRQSREMAKEVYDTTDDLIGLISSTVENPDIPQKGAHIVRLAQEYAQRVDQTVDTMGEQEKELPDEDVYEEDLIGLETKELDLKAVWTTAYVNSLPDSSFLYVASDCGKKEGGSTTPKSCRKFPYKDKSGKIDIPHIRNAIARIPQAKGIAADVKKSLQERARRILANATKEARLPLPDELFEEKFLNKMTDTVKNAVKSLFTKDGEDESNDSDAFMLWKDKDDRLRWFARYSNNFRDDDNPAEIIASKSHHRFVELVDKGAANMPVLELWHVPQWKFGEADWVAYDDTGFALASGTIDKGCEGLARFIAKQKGIAMSHGMPISSLKRDPNDSTTIVEHITEEISPLPAFAAANKYTGWELIGEQSKSKEDDMAIPAKKLETLVDKWNLDPDTLKSLEERNSEDAKAAKEEGRESKEKTTKDVENVEDVESTETTESTETEETEEESVDVMSETPTRQEIIDGFAPILSEMREQISGLSSQMQEMAKELKELKESDEVKIATKTQEAPAASIASLLGAQMRAVGNETAQVSGREKLAKSKPQETEPGEDGPFPVPFLNQMVKT